MTKNRQRVFSLLLVLAMLLACAPAVMAEGETVEVYLKPSSNWSDGGARFAVYYFGNGDGWVDMTDSGNDGFYRASVPAGTTIIFCRMNPNTTANDWSNKWNQTGDLALPTDGSNCFYAPEGTWDGADGSNWGTLDVAPEVTQPVFTAYTVAGEAGLCGNGWDPASNAMTETSAGIWSITFSNIEAGTYQFKVTDGTWNNSWGKDGGESNMSATVEAVSNVTITFNADTKAIDVAVAPAATEPEVTQPEATEPETPSATYTVAGEAGLCGEAWDLVADPMAKNADGLYEITFSSVAPGWYKFKVTDGTWDNSWGGGPNVDGDGNYVVEVAAVSNVTVVFDPDTQEITTVVTPTGEEVSNITYTVAGDAGLCGVEWDPAQNALTKNADGLHEITFYGIPAGNYGFKITEGKWAPGHEWPDQNYALALTEASDVTILFNEETKEISVQLVPATVAPTSYTVQLHFLPDSSWGSTINAWVWMNQNDNVPGYDDYHLTWPGKPITANADHQGWYDLTVITENAGGFKFIFNDGSNQTADLQTGALTGDLELWLIGEDRYTYAPEAWTGIPTYTYTVHYHNADNWSSVNAYGWVEDNRFLGDWNGTAATPTKGNDGWYSITFTIASDAVNLIFNGDGGQTADLAIAAPSEERNVEVWVDGDVTYTAPEGWTEVVPGNTVRIHFMPPYVAWGQKIYCWLWNGSGDVPGYEEYHKYWPGKRVEEDVEHPGWYTVKVTTELSGFNFIFSGTRQTQDLYVGNITGDMDIWVYGNDIYYYKPDVIPATGDTMNVTLFVGLAAVSLVALGAVLVIGKKKLA